MAQSLQGPCHSSVDCERVYNENNKTNATKSVIDDAGGNLCSCAILPPHIEARWAIDEYVRGALRGYRWPVQWSGSLCIGKMIKPWVSLQLGNASTPDWRTLLAATTVMMRQL